MFAFSPGSKGLVMAARKLSSSAERTWAWSPDVMSRCVDDGDQVIDDTEPGIAAGNSTTCSICSVSAERTVMLGELRVAMNCPLGLALQYNEAIIESACCYYYMALNS